MDGHQKRVEDKANEIVGHFFNILTKKNSNYKPVKEDMGRSFEAYERKAKELAVFHIEELIRHYYDFHYETDGHYEFKEQRTFFQEIREHIQSVDGTKFKRYKP